MTIKATPDDEGCYVSGWYGQYGTAESIVVAQLFGYDDTQAINLARRHLASMGRSNAPEPDLSDDEYAALSDAADDAEQWLNDHVAPEDYSFGWHEGEFFLWLNDQWDGIDQW